MIDANNSSIVGTNEKRAPQGSNLLFFEPPGAVDGQPLVNDFPDLQRAGIVFDVYDLTIWPGNHHCSIAANKIGCCNRNTIYADFLFVFLVKNLHSSTRAGLLTHNGFPLTLFTAV